MTQSRAGRKAQKRDTYPNQAQKLRMARGKTLAECADAINATAQAISRYEITGSGLGHNYRYALARFLGVTAEEMDQPPQLADAVEVQEDI